MITTPIRLLTVLALVAPAAAQDLGLGKMWTFENPPLAYLQEEYGFAPTQEWLDALRLASIRFGDGCSSSFVSPAGLILTNHHCVRDRIAEVQGDDDWVRDGLYARALEDEVPIPGLTVQQLVSMRDVTGEMNAGIAERDDSPTIAAKRSRNEAAVLEAAKKAEPDLSPQVVELYQGASYQLYSYRLFDDIRLVCAPHLQIAHFGGDPDNFTYPRYGIDFAFCRAWENGKPADTSGNYFRWDIDGVERGEVVFVTGNPGTTKRLLTKAQLDYMRDAFHPIVNQLIDSRLRIREEIVAAHPDREKELRTEILSWENTQKAYTGYWQGLLDPALMEAKTAAESAFRAKVQDDPALAARFGAVWGKLERVAEIRTSLEAKARFQTPADHPVLYRAVFIVRATDPGEAEDVREEFTRRAERPIAKIDDLARLQFIDHLARARDWLPPNDPYLVAVLRGGTPSAVADLLDNSPLYDTETVAKLLAGEFEGEVPALDMARTFVPLMHQNQTLGDTLDTVEAAQGSLLGQALHAVYGNLVSPDATFTLRFSDGVVDGYPYNGTIAPFRTTFYGLYGRNAAFGNVFPFDLPRVWLDRRAEIDMSRSVDLVSTNDIIGGNSGSPLVNRDLEVVGLVFDGNIEMLPNRYFYRGEVPRTVSVHVDGIMEALRKIYSADRVVDELIAARKER